MSDFGMSINVDATMDETLERVRSALGDQGFGILTEIDVATTLKAKLDVDVPPQIILGACNAPLARQGLQIEPDLELLLPCNVVVRAGEAGRTVCRRSTRRLMRSRADRSLSRSPSRPRPDCRRRSVPWRASQHRHSRASAALRKCLDGAGRDNEQCVWRRWACGTVTGRS